MATMTTDEHGAAENTTTKEESQLVTFLLENEEFGFDIMSVREIIRPPKMAKVPRTPPHVEGIANLRGVVLPIIDMRVRFGMARVEDTDRTRVLVVDIDGVKAGLRVDRVKQVTRVLRSDIEPPPPAIRGASAAYLKGVVKMDNGQRIIMALNAAEVCHLDVADQSRGEAVAVADDNHGAGTAAVASARLGASEAIQQLVTFRIGREEYAFPMENVREILRVAAPKQVPEVPDYILGVLTVRGRILPIVDLRRLLRQQSLAEEMVGKSRGYREEYAGWLESLATVRADASIPERLRAWVSGTNSSSQVLMELLSRVRGLNERVIKQLRALAGVGDAAALAAQVVGKLKEFEREVAANIREDQRIIVVDAGGLLVGLVVDHVSEVLNVVRKSLDRPPVAASVGGLELSAVAKLNDGQRLILVLDARKLLHDPNLKRMDGGGWDVDHAADKTPVKSTTVSSAGAAADRSEVQLVTFLLGGEEYGVPISKIQEIDRLSKITKVPKAASFIEGVTNLRGEVIPVLDTRKRFELEVKEADDRTRILIVDLGGVKFGLVVDSVREVLSLPNKDIAPPPQAIHSSIDQRFISGIGKVNRGKRMIVLLDVEKILSQGEQSALEEVSHH